MAKTNTGDDFVAGIIGGLLVLIFACGLLGWLCGWSDPSAPLASDKGKIDIIVEEVENKANELAGNIKKVVRRPSMMEREAAQLAAEVAAQERAEAIQQKMAAARVAAAKDQMYEWEEGLFEEPAAAPSSNAPRDVDARYAPASSAEGKDEASQMEDASRNSFAVSIVSDVRKSPERDLSRAMPRSRSSSNEKDGNGNGGHASARPSSSKSTNNTPKMMSPKGSKRSTGSSSSSQAGRPSSSQEASTSNSTSTSSSRPGSRAKSRPVSRQSSKLKVQSSSADSGLV